tara:strand:+ start:603 stop:1355 length:753 start_codon:yes stop_codon:yes gene_type:complete
VEIKKELTKFVNDIEQSGLQGALSLMGSYAWSENMMTIMNKLYKESAILFGNAVYRAVGVMGQKSDTFGFNSDWVKEVIDFLIQYGFTLVSNITQTTKAKLQEIVAKGIAEGKSMDEITRDIMSDETTGYSMMRAKRIARTEVMRSSNYASMIGADKHPFEVDKIWISARDKRTRRIPKDNYDHFNMNGQKVGWADDFTSTGKKGDLVLAGFPGDPTTPAGFSINCRCTVGFEARRDANGKLIKKNSIIR